MKTFISFCIIMYFNSMMIFSQAIIIDHKCTKIKQIPEPAIVQAKQKLHIAYGHTSHGSQITDGMTGLISFMNNIVATKDLYSWNNEGNAGALDLHDYAMSGDVGYYPDWVNNTRTYLGVPNPSTGRGTGTNADVNVIIWSWCGQVSGKYASGNLAGEYLDPMSKLEKDYFGIKFVYMTGHLDHWADADNKAANKMIRDYCIANNKILYDFADIESYDPDGRYFEFAGDDCSYYPSATGALIGNWAVEWQNTHIENLDWYNCGAAHSQPLNANQKAYAAWWLWSSIAGWDQKTSSKCEEYKNENNLVFPNPSTGKFSINLQAATSADFDIFDIKGVKIYSLKVTGFENEIDLTWFSRGLYLIRISLSNKIFQEKLLLL
jgi:hypothetical protein